MTFLGDIVDGGTGKNAVKHECWSRAKHGSRPALATPALATPAGADVAARRAGAVHDDGPERHDGHDGHDGRGEHETAAARAERETGETHSAVTTPEPPLGV